VLESDDSVPVSRQVDGLVDVMEDATHSFSDVLDKDRLCRWHAALFPNGASGLRRIQVGNYRDHEDPMQNWFASTRPGQPQEAAPLDGIARAAIAHLWFESR
jgi:hypothetical protein